NFSSGAAEIRREPLLHAVRMVTGSEYTAVRGETLPDAAAWMTADTVIHYALLSLLVIGTGRAIVMLRTVWRGRYAAIMLLLRFLFPVLAVSYTCSLSRPHHLLMPCPAGFVLASWGLLGVARWCPSRPALVVGLAALGLISGFSSSR